ncbi:MAG: hypothetical protein Q7J30_00960, partial [Candidatus Azambacteria bacterium]|nr:hypothetical protein [Candidatus Azambacteria bacterium]
KLFEETSVTSLEILFLTEFTTIDSEVFKIGFGSAVLIILSGATPTFGWISKFNVEVEIFSSGFPSVLDGCLKTGKIKIAAPSITAMKIANFIILSTIII